MDLQNVSQQEFERIEAYLNGELSKKDTVAFEEKLKNNPEFKTKFEDIKTVLTGIEAQAMKEQLEVFHKELSNEDKSIVHQPKIRFLNWQRVAAAAVLIISFGSFWWFNGNSSDRLYAKYFTPDPGLPTTMSNTDNYDFYEAMVNYKQGDYKTAVTKWEALKEAKPNNDTLNYFIASALLADKKENEAIPYFLKVTDLNNSVFKNETLYYLGLAYLKNDQKDKAIRFLEMSDVSKAKDILKKLK